MNLSLVEASEKARKFMERMGYSAEEIRVCSITRENENWSVEFEYGLFGILGRYIVGLDDETGEIVRYQRKGI